MKNLSSYLLIFTLFYTLTINPACAYSHGDDTRVIREKSFSISPGKKLTINADAGDIEVTPWDKSEVYVKVIGNKRAEEKFDFDFSANSDEVKVEADKKGGWGWFSNIKLKFEVRVPANFNIHANTAGGDVKLGGVKGDFVLKTSGGDINLFCKDAKIDANTSGGDIQLEYTGVNKGIELKTSGGDIEIKVPQDFNADTDLSTSGGDVECNLTLNNVKRLNDSIIIGSINKGGASLVAHTSGGDVIVKKK